MINHVRTLLLNRDGSRYLDGPGEEYVPQTYRQLDLPSYLQAVREILFGSRPDRLMLNYRLRQYLAVLHTAELEEFVLDLDSRITYPIGEDDLFDDVFHATINALDDTNGTLYLLGEPSSPDASGRTTLQFRITIDSGDTLTVKRYYPAAEFVENYTLTSGLSDPISLTGSGMQFRFSGAVGDSWNVTVRTRPRWDLGQITASLANLSEPVFVQLFGVGSEKAKQEPFRTYLNLWRSHPELPYRLGGLLLAVAYRTDEIRTEGP